MEFSRTGNWLCLEPEDLDFEAALDLRGFVEAMREHIPSGSRSFRPQDGTWLVRVEYERVVDLLTVLYLTPPGVAARNRAWLLCRLDEQWPCTVVPREVDRDRPDPEDSVRWAGHARHTARFTNYRRG